MADLEKLKEDLKRARDEMRLQLHLASKEAEDEWTELTGEWDKFLSRSQFDRSTEEVGEAARQLGLRMKDAYDRMKKAVD
ncbi:hypothetical protein [Tropicimonas sediminicola]|uniref:Uncharacterized protein n=1 Tax=Tropicimonas sediminicola TaxID=1031541 RepID=A0A239KEC9_9RHOB|nr:hypothetical protein [Tropicimonas sediminicola]SNT16068.1 hypothetical protein SAMN05421757_10732 [Tropicimonas sediminicola]